MNDAGQRVALILTPFREELEPVIRAVKDGVAHRGFAAYTSEDRGSEANLVKRIVLSIFEADLIICDLTYLNANVLYELGVSHALSKNSILICQKRAEQWVVSDGGRGDGRLPFDLNNYEIIPYINDDRGLTQLKERIRTRLDRSEGRRLADPVNSTLADRLAVNRILTYMLHGILLGAVSGFVASLTTAITGHGFIWAWHTGGSAVHTLMEGAGGGAVVGAFCMAAFAFVYGRCERRHDARWRRGGFVVATTIGGAVASVLVLTPYVILDSLLYGLGIALSISVPHLCLIVLGAIVFGWSVSIEPPLRVGQTFAAQLTRAALSAVLVFGFFAFVAYATSDRVFPAEYLARYHGWDPVVEAMRYTVAFTGLAASQWWLRWCKKL